MAGEIETATVLVVEDSLVNRRTIRRGVENEGYQVLEATDGAHALRVLQAEPVDMVLLDLLMPEVDGFEVLAAMGRDPDLAEVPVLVISAVETSDDVARALGMGAIDCLAKPVDPVLLRVRLRTALESVRLRRLERSYLRQELALRQQERLATLGRLSAGLGHELNNPAAAALSAARQLQAALADADTVRDRLLERTDAPTIMRAVEQHLADLGEQPRSAASRTTLADELAAVLSRTGVTTPWRTIDVLAEEGVDPDQLAALVAAVGEDVADGLLWFASRARIRRTLDNITASLQRIAELTAALRGYSYLDRAPQQDLDVRTGLDETLRILEHKRPAGVEVVRRYADELPTIHGYGGQLNQVWTNLLDNALHAVGEIGVVSVSVTADGDGVLVEVEDDGPGIDPDLLGSVFDPFVTTKPPGEGTGLGLSISHQIVTEAHGGRLTVTSEPGRTVFRVQLPRHVADGGDHDA